MQKIAGSEAEIVELEEDCSVLEWARISKPENSELNALLMLKWRITEKKKLYFNK